MIKTIPDMLSTVARENPEKIAIVEGEKRISYARLEKRCASLALTLFNLGVRQGDRVALLLPNGLDFVTGYFAIAMTGAIVVPLNEHYQQTELLYFLEECGISRVITSKEFSPLFHQVLSVSKSPFKLFFIEDHPEAVDSKGGTLEEWNIEIDPLAPVMYQYSSGSTGRPKRIGRNHENLLFELDSLIRTLHITKEDRFLGAAPFSHVNGLMRSMMASLRAGATLYPLPKFDRQRMAEAIEKNSISVFIGVPLMPIMLAKTSFRRPPDLSSLRLCITASAPMPKKLSELFYEKFGIPIRQLYGSTETGTISVNLSPDIEQSLESVGTPIEGVEVNVFKEDGNIAEVNETGELAVKSPAAINAYEGLDEVNREVFRKGHFLTGDLGKKDENGLLYLVGRKKFFINKGGYKIDPHGIEELLEGHASVEEAVVIGVPTLFGDEKVKAVVVLKKNSTEEEIIEYCRGKIADFKIPSLIEFRESLPKSPTGKILRKMLI